MLCVQVNLPREVVSQALSAKKQSKKQRIKAQGDGSSKAYYDIYGQQVSIKCHLLMTLYAVRLA